MWIYLLALDSILWEMSEEEDANGGILAKELMCTGM